MAEAAELPADVVNAASVKIGYSPHGTLMIGLTDAAGRVFAVAMPMDEQAFLADVDRIVHRRVEPFGRADG